MRKQDERLLYSPSDVLRFLESPFASWMTRLGLEDPEALEPDAENEQLRLIADEGRAHEQRFLERLEAEGRDVCRIPSFPGAFAATREALAEGREVIYQAALERGPFRGYADFLVQTPEAAATGGCPYEVWDTKLASSVKPYYLVQLCLYAEMLEGPTGAVPEHVGVILGTGELVRYRTEAFLHYARAVRDAFLEQMETFDRDSRPEPDPGAQHGVWQSHADAWLESVDHLSRVAGMSTSQTRKLEAAGIGTLTDLAETTLDHVRRLDDGILARLKEQARLQRASAGKARPDFHVIEPEEDDPHRGLARMPPNSPMDVFFDMEGYPLTEGGLEYLFGAVEVEGTEPTFIDYWAFDPQTEKRALEDFVDHVMDRWRRDPTMHVYHYGHYETTALKRLMGRYATREEEVDHLLRRHVFVDLLKVVREGLRIGTPSYSLKYVEHLYMEREGEQVATAGESIVQFARWLESGEDRDWRASPLLKGIRAYNEEDCLSTWLLAKWLWERQDGAGINWVPPDDHADGEDVPPLPDAAQAKRDLADRLLARSAEQAEPASTTSEMLAWLLEFHRREDKPVWWSLFERNEMTFEQHVDDSTCIGNAVRTSEDPFPEKRSTCYAYTFDPHQETKVKEGSTLYVAGCLEAAVTAHEVDLERGHLVVKVGPSYAGRCGEGLPSPASFLLFEHVRAGSIAQSIEDTARAWDETDDLPAPLGNLLADAPPPVRGHATGPLLAEGEDLVAGVTRLVENLDGGTLAVQGPPGSGKTYVASHVIHHLLAEGKNVGITSNSHEAVFNLMDAVRERAGGDLPCMKIGTDTRHAFFERCPSARAVSSGGDAYAGGLIGGTAWLFSRPEMAERLDVLFVDEAGQVSIANLVGMARSARNIVLLGDQMQLAQVVQGTHPGRSGESALTYVLGEHATVPPDLGVFLPRTWRLHPGICDFISRAVYEGRLEPERHTQNRLLRLPTNGGTLVPTEAGVLFSPVEHEGNTQASDEEVERIVAIVDEILGREVTDSDGEPAGRLGITDVLVVAPYNLQVRRLVRALPEGARVASVDKFQGQEAPVVIASLCTSPGESGPRGLEFVLDKHRLNVAVSRARSLAIVVGDPRLVLSPASSLEDVRRLNLLAHLKASSGP